MDDVKKNKDFPILIILILIVSIINFGINMHDQIFASLRNQWGQVAFRTPEEEQRWKEDYQNKQMAAEKAKARLIKYEQTEKYISILCSIGGIILTIYSLLKRKNLKLHVICTVLMILNTIILIF
ncbi:MAG: hypothetical protein IJI58_02075 [Bacilli bacterium]|nr:hypothetical protein [Bacilli bacterium]